MASKLMLPALLLTATTALGQAGANDPTFNPVELGNGAGADGIVVNSMAQYPDGKTLIGGQFNAYNGIVCPGLTRVFASGAMDMGFIPEIGSFSIIENVIVQPDGRILISGDLYSQYLPPFTYWAGLARLHSDGSLDTTFGFGTGATTGSGISSMALQPDGKILIAGGFNFYNGTPCNSIARLNNDGSLDTSFNSGAGVGNNPGVSILAMVLQPDGKIVIGGEFDSYDGTVRNGTARLNSDGSLDLGYDPIALNHANALSLQPDGKILVGGSSYLIGGFSKTLLRLNVDGSLDFGFNYDPPSPFRINTIALQPDGKVLIGGMDLIIGDNNIIQRLNSDGSLDAGFNNTADPSSTDFVSAIALQPNGDLLIGGQFYSYDDVLTPENFIKLDSLGEFVSDFNPQLGASGEIQAMGIQPDGKILIAGGFIGYNGTPRRNIARLNSDGSLDPGFDPGPGPGGIFTQIMAMAVQPDGKILVGGQFETFDGMPRNGIARVNGDGSLDLSFDPGTGLDSLFNVYVKAITVQPDGKVLIGGAFTSYNGTPRQQLARLNSDGSLDASFDPGSGTNSPYYGVRAIALQPDGKILIGGDFITYDGTAMKNFARINSDGSLDPDFEPGTGPNDPVEAIVLQPLVGTMLIGGQFTQYNGTPRHGIARVESDGGLDATFNPGTGISGGYEIVNAIAVQPDGKILIGGPFEQYQGMPRRGIVRINGDGIIDLDFDPGPGVDAAYPSVEALDLQPDGRILIGGGFHNYHGVGRNNIARALSDDATVSINPVSPPDASGSAISTWPNPSYGDQVQLTLSGLGAFMQNVQVELYDATGRQAMATVLPVTGGHMNCKLEVGALAQGIYLVQVIAGEQVHSTRLVVSE
ncbi:MAG: T9SS type A sorting domain-containing protein [Flavobacteriales bacterium]|nr:T9SS type A sorting domain-containing protein [Flavobacteriales bacterium]